MFPLRSTLSFKISWLFTGLLILLIFDAASCLNRPAAQHTVHASRNKVNLQRAKVVGDKATENGVKGPLQVIPQTFRYGAVHESIRNDAEHTGNLQEEVKEPSQATTRHVQKNTVGTSSPEAPYEDRRRRREVEEFSSTLAEQVIELLQRRDVITLHEKLTSHVDVASLNLPQDELGGETVLSFIINTTPEHATALEAVAFLVNRGVDPTIPNVHGTVPLLASLKRKDSLASLYILEHVLNHTTPVNEERVRHRLSVPNDAGDTPLCVALVYQQLDIVDLLLDLQVTRTCRVDGVLCCDPLRHAASMGDVSVMKRLLSTDPHVGESFNEALRMAVKHGHVGITRLLLQHAPSLISNDRFIQSLSRGGTHTVEYLLYIMEEQKDSSLVEAILEIEMAWRNPQLCVIGDKNGRSLMFNSIYYGYKKVTERLVMFYDEMRRERYSGYSYCYADKADLAGRCPSSVLLFHPQWNNITQNRYILTYLFSSRHPLTGENCLHKALVKKESAVSVFQDIGQHVVTLYGSDVLDLAGIDMAGNDVFLRAIEVRAPQAIIVLILQWLLEGSTKGISQYVASLRQGLLVAAGGTRNWKDPFLETETYPMVIEAAAVVCPEVLYALLFNIPLSDPSNEPPYAEIITSFSAAFPNLRDSPLSQSVKGSLGSFGLRNNISFLRELLGAHNLHRFHATHFTYALEVATEGKVPQGKLMDTHMTFSTNTSPFTYWLRCLAIQLRRWTGSPMFSLLSDKRLVTKGLFPREIFLGYYGESLKRVSIIVELLMSPMTKPNDWIHRLSIQLFGITALYGCVVCALHVYLITTIKDQGVLLNVSSIADILPVGRCYWITAFFEGLRRGFLVPRSTDFSRVGFHSFSLKLHVSIIQILGWFYHLGFLWCLIEIWVLTENTNGQETSLGPIPSGLSIEYYSPLRFLFPCIVLVHTILSKVTGAERVRWISWVMVGPKVPNQSLTQHDAFLCRFHWLTKCNRDLVSYLRSLQRLPSRKYLSRLPLCFNEGYMEFRDHACSLRRTSRFQRLWDVVRGSQYRCSYVGEQNVLCESADPSCAADETSFKQPVTPYHVFSQGKQDNPKMEVQRERLERHLLQECIAPFGELQASNFMRHILILYVSCFLAAHFPLWRCFQYPFKMLYFDVFVSEAKFKAYMTSNSAVLLLREFVMFVVLWQQLIQVGFPILLAIQLTTTMKRSAAALESHFPLKSERLLISPFSPRKTSEQTCREARSHKEDILSPSLVIMSVKTYLDVRQSLVRQFAYIWEPLEAGLTAFCLYWGFFLLFMCSHFHHGSLRKHYYYSKYNQPASQLFLAFLWIEWLSIQALMANAAFDKSWAPLQRIHLQPDNVTTYRRGKRVLFQAVNFFKQHEFRLTLASVRLNTAFAAAYLFFYTAFFVEFTLMVDQNDPLT